MIAMTHTNELLRRVLVKCDEVVPSQPERDDAVSVHEVPTLDPSVCRPVSPMLHERFLFCGRWELATHGDWLNVDEMSAIANNDSSDARIAELIDGKNAAALEWANDAGALFRADRLSLFAASCTSYERVYLLWLDETIEPELWVYDANGEARYRSLDDYLEAFLSDDMSAYESAWRLAEQ